MIEVSRRVLTGSWSLRTFRSEWARSPIWAKVVGAVLVPIGFLISLLVEGASRIIATTSSWRHLAGVLSPPRRWITYLGLPYFLIHFLIGTVLELAGKLVVATVSIATALVVILLLIIAVPLKLIFWPLLTVTHYVLEALRRGYPPALRWSLAHPGVILTAVLACFWITWTTTRSLDSELMPEVYQGEFTVEVALPVGTPLDQTDEILSPVEEAILEEKGNIRSMILSVGYDPANVQRSDEGEHTARFKILLDEEHRNAEAEAEVIARLRSRLDEIPDLDARVARPILFSSKTPIEVEVHGNHLPDLREQSGNVREALLSLPSLADVDSTQRSGAPEVQVKYDRDLLASYGLSIGRVASSSGVRSRGPKRHGSTCRIAASRSWYD